MGDYDRDRDPHDHGEPARDREHIRETERTTTVVTGDGDRRGGSGWIVAILVLIALLALLWFLFGGGLNRAADDAGVNVNVEAPDVSVPDEIKVDVPDDVNLPEVDVDTGGNSQ